ncbi:MAG: deoxyhypusine synthase [Methanomicrobiales archaeon]|nr:deoxyhypusine synthase [Methanomicrobiales archaeon]
MEKGEPVGQIRLTPGMTVGELMAEWGRSGAFNAGALHRASVIYREMLDDASAVRFFGLAGAMVPAGMGGIVSDLVKMGYIDVLVSTGANLVHDIIEAIGCHHLHGTAACDDRVLRDNEINRIYDVYLPGEAFERFEEFIQGVLGDFPRETRVSTADLLKGIGKRLDHGILASAAEQNVPVYCPAIQDSMLGLQIWLFSQTHTVRFDAFADMKEIIDRSFSAERAGVMIVGGGVPKNYILQTMLLTPKGFDYAIQLTGDRPDLGGLSGATLDEAKSWGKLEGQAKAVTVYGDATITLPLLVASVLEGT